jgi:hypothetical protein
MNKIPLTNKVKGKTIKKTIRFLSFLKYLNPKYGIETKKPVIACEVSCRTRIRVDPIPPWKDRNSPQKTVPPRLQDFGSHQQNIYSYYNTL